ncbi:glycosyltransferase family 15 protein [Mycena alexandri]|uniref:Glycosyltransferase family 15 protein n=1 Tax=Mycena alexandri TaxID=1745969 RepID=A0AAD6WUL5_9AGAR|nr:glycosyltransferase family 15 protein [Mycena alexandri]
MLRRRHIYLGLASFLTLYYLFVFRRRTPPVQNLYQTPPPKIWHEPPYNTPIPEKYYRTQNTTQRASAAIVILARNRDRLGMISSLTQFEEKFNKKFGYPYVFFNEEPFSEDFKREISALTSAPVQFGLIPPEHWYQPAWIDEDKASRARTKLKNAPYGDSVPYRNMCRYQSGFFFRSELLKPFKYYWRIEPDVRFFCDIDFDPFLFMQGEDKKYAFTISFPEIKSTVKGLWPAVVEFVQQNPALLSPDNALEMLKDRKGYYNMCHFWSNFEIASLDLWRSPAYIKFFEHLDSKGGFYYHRWGDAPVHSIGAALFARKDQIHFFNEIGYAHMPFEHCPTGPSSERGRCTCDPTKNFDRGGFSCLRKYDELFDLNRTSTSTTAALWDGY